MCRSDHADFKCNAMFIMIIKQYFCHNKKINGTEE